MVANEVDGIVRSVDHVHDAIGSSRFAKHVDEHHARARIAFRWLDDVRVAAYESNGEHLRNTIRYKPDEIVRL